MISRLNIENHLCRSFCASAAVFPFLQPSIAYEASYESNLLARNSGNCQEPSLSVHTSLLHI